MQELLSNEYEKLKSDNLSITGKVNILNNIIQFKLNEIKFQNFNHNLSIDVKYYFNSLIELAEMGPNNYDTISLDRIDELLQKINYNDRIIYLNYFIRLLEKGSFKNELKEFQKIKNQEIVKNSIKNFLNINSIWKLFIYFPLINIYSLFLTLFIILVIINLILLPAPFEFMEILNYDLSYLELSDNFFLNHSINITSALIGANPNFKITPLDITSIILLVIGKLFIYIYVISLVLGKLTDLIKR